MEIAPGRDTTALWARAVPDRRATPRRQGRRGYGAEPKRDRHEDALAATVATPIARLWRGSPRTMRVAHPPRRRGGGDADRTKSGAGASSPFPGRPGPAARPLRYEGEGSDHPSDSDRDTRPESGGRPVEELRVDWAIGAFVVVAVVTVAVLRRWSAHELDKAGRDAGSPRPTTFVSRPTTSGAGRRPKAGVVLKWMGAPTTGRDRRSATGVLAAAIPAKSGVDGERKGSSERGRSSRHSGGT